MKSTGLRFEMLANDGTEKCIEPIVDATVEGIIESFCAFEELPAWMDTNWFLQKCSYENHLLLVRSGVLPPDLFAESKRDYLWARAACVASRFSIETCPGSTPLASIRCMGLGATGRQ